MDIKLPQPVVKTVNPNQGKVVVSANPIRTREMLDKFGNIIDPKTKQILIKAEENK